MSKFHLSLHRIWSSLLMSLGRQLLDHVLLPLVQPELQERDCPHGYIDGRCNETVDAHLIVQAIYCPWWALAAGRKERIFVWLANHTWMRSSVYSSKLYLISSSVKEGF